MSDYDMKDSVICEITKTIDALSEILLRGGAQDYATYRHKCGVILGLRDAIEIVQKSVNNYMLIDDDDDDE